MSPALSTTPPTASRRRSRLRFGASAGLEALDDIGDLLVDRLALAHLALDLLHRVDHRRVITTAEQAGDARVAEIGLLTEHVHRDLTTRHQRSLAALALQRVDL